MGNAQRKEKDDAHKASAKASKADKTKKDGRRTLQEEFQSGDDIQSSFETIQKDEIKGLDADGKLSTAGASEAIGDSNQGKHNVMFHDLVQQLDSFSIPIKSVTTPADSAIDGQELEKIEGSALPVRSSGELFVPSQGESAAYSLEAQKVLYDKDPEETVKQSPTAQMALAESEGHGDQSVQVSDPVANVSEPMSQEAVQDTTDRAPDKSIPEPQEKHDPPNAEPRIDVSEEAATNNEVVQEGTPKPDGVIIEDVQPRQVKEKAEGLKVEADQEFEDAALRHEHAAAILDPVVDNREFELAGVSVPPEEAPLPGDIKTEEDTVNKDVEPAVPSEAVNQELTDSNFELSEGPETTQEKEEKLEAYSGTESKMEASEDSKSAKFVDTDASEDPQTTADNSTVVKGQEENSLMVEKHAPVVEEKLTALPQNEMVPSGNGEVALDTAELGKDHPSNSVASADASADWKDVEAEVPTAETEPDEDSIVAPANDYRTTLEESTASIPQDAKEDTIAPVESTESKEQVTEEPIADSVPEDAFKQMNSIATNDSSESIVKETDDQTTGNDFNQPVGANEPPAEENTEGTREDASAAVEINESEEVTDEAVDVVSPIEDTSKYTDVPDDSIAANDQSFSAEDPTASVATFETEDGTREDSIDAVEINDSEAAVEETTRDQNESTVLDKEPQETLHDSVVTDDSMASTVEETSHHIGSITDKAAERTGAAEPEEAIASTGSDAKATKEDSTTDGKLMFSDQSEVPVEDTSEDQNEPTVPEEDPQETPDVADDSMASVVEETSDAEATTEEAIAEKDPANEVPDKASDVLAPVDTYNQDTQEPIDSSGIEEASRETHAGSDAASEPVDSTVEETNGQSTGSVKDEANVVDSTKHTTGESAEVLGTEEPAESTDTSIPTIAEEGPAAIEETSSIKAEDTSANITDDADPKEDLEETKEAATLLNEQINKDLMAGEKTSEERQNDEVVANVDVPELIEMQENVDGINGEVQKESKEPAETSEVKNVDSTTEEPNTNEDHEVKNKDEASVEEPRDAPSIDENVQAASEGATEATGVEDEPSEADEVNTGAIGEDSQTVENPEPITAEGTFAETKAEAGNEGPTVDSFSAEDGTETEPTIEGPIEVKGQDVPTAEASEMNTEESPTIEDQATTKDLTNIEVENATEKSEEPGAVDDIEKTNQASASNEEVTIREPIEVKGEELPSASLVPKEANEINKDDQPNEIENATEKSEEPGAVEDPKEADHESAELRDESKAAKETSLEPTENAHEDLTPTESDAAFVAIAYTTETDSQPATLEDTSSSQ